MYIQRAPERTVRSGARGMNIIYSQDVVVVIACTKTMDRVCTCMLKRYGASVLPFKDSTLAPNQSTVENFVQYVHYVPHVQGLPVGLHQVICTTSMLV